MDQKMNRKQIAAELMHGVPDESRDDHQKIAYAILAGETVEKILEMRETNDWPSTYAWLKTKLNEKN